jgi:hypothetical protein
MNDKNMKESSSNSASARRFFILTLIFSLISAGILTANTTIGIEAFAKKVPRKSLIEAVMMRTFALVAAAIKAAA